MEILSPLRYPGGKANLSQYIKIFCCENLLYGSSMIELFAGGASVSLYLLKENIIADTILVEKDPLVASFWMAVVKHNDELCDRIISLKKIDLSTWERSRRYLATENIGKNEIVNMALSGLILNRTSFSGILHAGPIGGYQQKSQYKVNCRFNSIEIVRRIQELKKFEKRIKVRNCDAINFLRQNRDLRSSRDAFFYADPPYYYMGHRLYRHFYLEQDHIELSSALAQIKNAAWLVSYDNAPLIRKLYKPFQIRRVDLSYTIKKARKERELLISNSYLPSPIYTKIAKRT